MSLDRFGRPPPGQAPARPLPLGDYRFVALDVETACGPVSSICQIGLACVRGDGGIETWSTFVDPGAEIVFSNTWLHGIGRAHVAGAPLFPAALDLLAPLLPGMEQPPHPMRLGDDEGAYYRNTYAAPAPTAAGGEEGGPA